MPLQLYLDPATVNSRKVLAGLELLGLPFDLHSISFENGEHKSEAHLKINPNGTVPAATDGDLKLFESNAILMYAADISGATTAYPQDHKQRADAYQWLFWEQTSWFPPNYVYLTENVFKPSAGMAPDLAALEAAASTWHAKAAILEARLAETGGWILHGTAPTIVDIAMAAPMHGDKKQKLPLADYPHLRRWYSDVARLPSWQKTQGHVSRKLLLDQ